MWFYFLTQGDPGPDSHFQVRGCSEPRLRGEVGELLQLLDVVSAADPASGTMAWVALT